MRELVVPSRLVQIVTLMVVLASNAEAAFDVGTQLPRPDLIPGGLVQPNKFALPTAELDPATRVVVFFYSAAWCAPCQRIGATLRQTHSDLQAGMPGLQIISYAVDGSPRARADYLRSEPYPWLALGPAVIDQKPWLTSIPGGTPQFQAFAVGTDLLTAITPGGPADAIMRSAMRFLQSNPE